MHIKVLFGTDVGVPCVCPCTGEVYIAADSNASSLFGIEVPKRSLCYAPSLYHRGREIVYLTFSIQGAYI